MLASFAPVGPPRGDGVGAHNPRAESAADAPEGAERGEFAALVEASGQPFPAPHPHPAAGAAASGHGAPHFFAPLSAGPAGGKSLPLGGTFVLPGSGAGPFASHPGSHSASGGAPREASLPALLDSLARAPVGGAPGVGAAFGAIAGGLADGRAAEQGAVPTALLGARSIAAEGDPASRLLVRPEAGDAATQPFSRPAAPAVAEPLAPLPMPSPGGTRSGFDQAVGERILWMARNGMSQAEIRVRPEHLGPIEARLSLDGDRVQLQLSASSAFTREVLEQALPRLRGMLEEAGLQLGDAAVAEGSDGEADAGGAGEAGEDLTGATVNDEPRGGEPGANADPAPSSDRHLLDVFV